MNRTRQLLAALILLTSVISSNASESKSEQSGAVTKLQVDKFMQTNRSNLLLTYHCANKADTSSCAVYCSSGGAKFIEAKNVQRAYYAERLKKLDGALAGFFLVIDVEGNKDKQDLWATLQTESSCYFEGMTPAL